MSDPDRDLLEVRDLAFRFEDKEVLRGCSFSVRHGDRLVIMGTSGGGKSTLLRLILGILTPDRGSIRFDGRQITEASSGELNEVRGRMGMVFQGAALISSLSVRENLALPLRELTDKSPSEIDSTVDDKLRLVGLEETAEKLPSELSGGMKKRIGLARALMLEPELILFDEPGAGLDPVNASLVDEIIVSVAESTQATCIVVTHSMQSAFRIATRMAMLHEGTILEEDVPEVFQKSPNPIVRQFVSGDPKGPLTEGHAHAHAPR